MLQTTVFFYVTQSQLKFLSSIPTKPFPHRKFLLAATLKKIKEAEILELLTLPEFWVRGFNYTNKLEVIYLLDLMFVI